MKRLYTHHSCKSALKAFRWWCWRKRSLCTVSGELGRWHSWSVCTQQCWHPAHNCCSSPAWTRLLRDLMCFCVITVHGTLRSGAGKTEPLAGAAMEAAPTLWLVGNTRQHSPSIASLDFFLHAFRLLGGKKKKGKKVSFNVSTHSKIRINPQKSLLKISFCRTKCFVAAD